VSHWALVVVLVLAAPVLAGPPGQQEVEESLTCQCGCGLTVHSCNHLQCPSGEPMKDEIRRRIGAGESKETILASFVTEFGEKVLSSPTMQGFNLLAWVTPFAVILIAGLSIMIVVRRRVHQHPEAPIPTPAGLTDEMRARLERELTDIDHDT